MASPLKMTGSKASTPVIKIEKKTNLKIHEGYVSQKEESVLVKRGRKTIAKVHLSEPVMVAMAEQEESWGYFQFPSIGRADDGTLVVEWQMRPDSHKSYGTSGMHSYTPRISIDNGEKWTDQDKRYITRNIGYNVYLKDGSYLEVNTPASQDIKSFSNFPQPIGIVGNTSFYLMDSLPDILQGVFLYYRTADNKSENIHAILNDPGSLRYAIDDLMPVTWWGNIKQLDNNLLVAGVYPTFYIDKEGDVTNGGVSFYSSKDKGHSWDLIGKIMYPKARFPINGGDNSFSEPSFEVLPNGTFTCVMRTGSTTPMYQSFSEDEGKTWSKPKAIAPNGVKPKLMMLNNGVLVLASGRPGIQIRFNLDGKGKQWTEPLDMIPFMKEDGSYIRDVSCGYTSLIEADDNSFFIVYSDFTTKNDAGETRKSIWCRRVYVKRNNN